MAVLVCGLAARRFRVAPPVLLLACGALLGFATALRRVHLPPEVVLLLFLPALLYWESITTSLREIRSNLRTIILLSTGLVIATAAAVAAVAHALGLGWGPAWVLGAAVAPTDATAVGVLAVVVCGLIISQAGPRLGRADTRQQTVAFWSLATFLLNGALFVLVGLELQAAVRGLTSDALTQGLIAVIAVSATVVGARFAWLFTTPYLIRALDRRPQQRLRRVGARARVVSAMAGFRGAVSLAAALAVPETVESGAPFPGRDVIIFVTAGVIVVTLVAQGLLLPAVVHWARLPRDTSVETERHFAEIPTEEALAAMPQLAAGLGTDPEVSGRLNREYAKHLRLLRANDAGADDEPALRYDQQYTALRLAVLAHKRATVLRLRDERRIDDIVLRQIQTRLDIEEVRLSRRETVE